MRTDDLTDLKEKYVRILHSEIPCDTGHCTWDDNHDPCVVARNLEEAIHFGLKVASQFLDNVVEEHRSDTEHTENSWCEDFGCGSLARMAGEIRKI